MSKKRFYTKLKRLCRAGLVEKNRNSVYKTTTFGSLVFNGQVKMLDESEGDVAENEKHLAFNNQSLWVRVAIVLAGPLFNFLFAFVARKFRRPLTADSTGDTI